MFRTDWVKKAEELKSEVAKVQKRLNFAPYVHRAAIKTELDKVNKDYKDAAEKAAKQKASEKKKAEKQRKKK